MADFPEAGETILHCGHLDRAESSWHWFHAVPDPAVIPPTDRHCFEFQRPDGSTGEASWIAVCERCFAALGPNPTTDTLPVRGDGVWAGGQIQVKASN